MMIQGDGTVEVGLEISLANVSELLELQSFEESSVNVSFMSATNASIPRLQIVIFGVGT